MATSNVSSSVDLDSHAFRYPSEIKSPASRRGEPELLDRTRALFLLALLLMIFLIMAKLMVPNRTVLPFIYPAAAFSMLVAVLVGPGMAMTATVVLAGLVGVMAGNALELVVYTAIGGIRPVRGVAKFVCFHKFMPHPGCLQKDLHLLPVIRRITL